MNINPLNPLNQASLSCVALGLLRQVGFAKASLLLCENERYFTFTVYRVLSGKLFSPSSVKDENNETPSFSRNE